MSRLDGELEILGRVTHASNHTFLCELCGTEDARATRYVVYKPVSGERPLWDFTTGTLADREYAAHVVSEALGWEVVPPTVLREGPRGLGMVQEWIDVDESIAPVDICRPGEPPPGYRHVLDAEGGDGRPVQLVHEDTPTLRRIAAFDLIVNNTDRKGGHILPTGTGHRYGIDHGVCFHPDDKVRTVLWGFAGEAIAIDVLADIARVADDAELLAVLAEHLTELEVERFVARCARICRSGRYPEMGGGWPPIPWPPF